MSGIAVIKETSIWKHWNFILLLLIFTINHNIFCQEYGRPGAFRIKIDTVETGKKLFNRNYFVLYPDTSDVKFPCILFYPKYGINNIDEYKGLIHHMVSKGTVVIFFTYPPMSFRRKNLEKHTVNLHDFNFSVQNAINIIDTTRIAFFGHGFGGGIIPAIARNVAHKKEWGGNGLFLYITSPYYFHGITKRELRVYPDNAILIMQIFENDNVNDPTIARKLFELIGIPSEQKKFLRTYGYNDSNSTLKADHTTPLSKESHFGKDNILDTVSMYFFFDIAMEAAFNKNKQALQIMSHINSDTTFSMRQEENTIIIPNVLSSDAKEFGKVMPYINPWISVRNPFTEITRFRKARKLFFKHYKDKITKLVRHVVVTKKQEKGTWKTVDILENPIDSGYGASGSFTVIHDSIPSLQFEREWIRLFYPKEKKKPSSVIILLHGYSGPNYFLFEPLINHIVSRGTAIMFPPYPRFPLVSNEKEVTEKQNIIKDGIETGFYHFQNLIDRSQVGFIGQSFGAGQIPYLAYWLFIEKQWGDQSGFMFLTAPWYTLGIDSLQLKSFPKHLKLVVMVFDDDKTNDHQIAIDFFKSVNIDKRDKDYIIMYSDSSNGYKMNANHFVPYGCYSPYGEENLLDYFGIYKLIDAMIDYSFNKNELGKMVALGNGSREQIYMGDWDDYKKVKQLEVTDNPSPTYSEFSYFFPWNNQINTRRLFYKSKSPFLRKIIAQQKARKKGNK